MSELSIYKNLETSNPIKLFNSGVLSKQVICLPIYPELSIEHVMYITDKIKKLSGA
ncbi:hypothetical protein EMO40_26145 [Escherichia coli]|nr:hypothetical protein [Escherichia coli]